MNWQTRHGLNKIDKMKIFQILSLFIFCCHMFHKYFRIPLSNLMSISKTEHVPQKYWSAGAKSHFSINVKNLREFVTISEIRIGKKL